MAGTPIETMDTLVRYTMSRKAAEDVKRSFMERSRAGEGVSYMDCVLFDAALGVLGEEQAYYGMSDEEWAEKLKGRAAEEKRYRHVKTVDVTDTWREVDGRG